MSYISRVGLSVLAGLAAYFLWLILFALEVYSFPEDSELLILIPIATGIAVILDLCKPVARESGRGGSTARGTAEKPRVWWLVLGLISLAYLVVEVILRPVYYFATPTWYFSIGQGSIRLQHGVHIPGWGLRPNHPHLNGTACFYGWVFAVVAWIWMLTWLRGLGRVVTRFVGKAAARFQFPEGHCQYCGYDLTGNVSGVCPECGRRILR